MSSIAFDTKRAAGAPDAIAPDGAEVRLLGATGRGSMALFTLPPGAVSRAVAHRTVEEIWYVVRGAGRMWRERAGRDEITALEPGVSLTIPAGTYFQFRNDGAEPLEAVAVTMPPWPGAEEAYPVEGKWPASLIASASEPGNQASGARPPGYNLTATVRRRGDQAESR